MRLDHLLSKEKSKGCFSVQLSREQTKRGQKNSGGDALRGNTRPHPEHEG